MLAVVGLGDEDVVEVAGGLLEGQFEDAFFAEVYF